MSTPRPSAALYLATCFTFCPKGANWQDSQRLLLPCDVFKLTVQLAGKLDLEEIDCAARNGQEQNQKHMRYVLPAAFSALVACVMCSCKVLRAVPI